MFKNLVCTLLLYLFFSNVSLLQECSEANNYTRDEKMHLTPF
jgi:hypothetical protein